MLIKYIHPPLHLHHTQLAVLLPPLQNKLAVIKPTLLARFCASPDTVATSLLFLKSVFPLANVATMAMRCPGLVLGDVPAETIEDAAAQLRRMLPDIQVRVCCGYENVLHKHVFYTSMRFTAAHTSTTHTFSLPLSVRRIPND